MQRTHNMNPAQELAARQIEELRDFSDEDHVTIDAALLTCALILREIPYECRVIVMRQLQQGVDLDNPKHVS